MTTHKGFGRYVSGTLGWLWLIITIVPIYYIVITSLRSQSSFYTENPLLPTGSPTLKAYADVFQNKFWMYFLNTAIVTVVSVAVILLV